VIVIATNVVEAWGQTERFVIFFITSQRNTRELPVSFPIRLNPTHSETVFRVDLYDLPPKTTYYYKVESVDSTGKSDGVTSPVNSTTTL